MHVLATTQDRLALLYKAVASYRVTLKSLSCQFRAMSSRVDPCSVCNLRDIATQHISFDWQIDWNERLISGSATHRLLALKDGVDKVVLDTKFLSIKHAWIEGKKANFEIGQHHPVSGSALTIELPRPMEAGTQALIQIEYSTTKDCSALGWLEKEQTGSGELPFLYSQCQSIHARSLFPCADTPSNKLTYDARITSSLPAATVLMSARRVAPPLDFEPTSAQPSIFYYNQPTPIPPYLVAIAAGEIKFAALGARTGVYAASTQLADSKWEFEADTEEFLIIAEKIFDRYRWGSYDVLVLPKSFPYGGMENSNLTFLTPTLLTGDRKLVDVIAHELCHSWFGNLVSCADWQSSWLNEGFTTWAERVLVGQRYGAAHRDFSYIIGRSGLRKDLEGFAEQGTTSYQRLFIPMKEGDDPEDSYSRVAYDKGSNFLLHIERTVGGLDAFLPYVRDYIKTFVNKSLDTETWKKHLFAYFEKHHGQEGLKKLNSIDWDAWLHGEGTDLPVDIKYDTSLADSAYALAAKWTKARDSSDFTTFSAGELKDFNAGQVVVFLETLYEQPAFSPKFVAALDKAYGFDKSGNAEIRSRWYNVALASGPEYGKSGAEWVADKGRGKFCRPLYKALVKVDPELAKSTFLQHESFYHPIMRPILRKDLKITS